MQIKMYNIILQTSNHANVFRLNINEKIKTHIPLTRNIENQSKNVSKDDV